jgi:hypothetical protein
VGFFLKESARRWLLNCILPVFALGPLGCISPVNAQRNSTAVRDPETQIVHNKPKVAVRTSQKFNPVWWFGNADDPEPPEWYAPGDPARRRKWHLRNPLHNFTFYVVGVADKPFERVGRNPQDVFHPDGGWNWATCRYKHCRLPFFSYKRGRFATYWGWRERGNFGLKLTFRREKPAPPPRTEE